VKVYHDRSSSELITIGGMGDIRYQNVNASTPSGKIKSIVIDNASNISAVASQFASVDWTPPIDVLVINDGIAADISVTTSNTELSANWSPTTDPNSDIARYWYSIGTAPGLTDVVNWTDNWYDTLVTHTGLSLVYGTTYYFNVRAENGAELLSNVISSNGQILDLPVNPPVANFNVINTYTCITDSIQFLNSSQDATSYEWTVPGGIPASSTDANPYFQFPVSGNFEVTLIATGPGGTDTDIQFITIETQSLPDASFSQSAASVSLDYAFVTFTNNSLNANGYFWDFGDGNNSSDAAPWHEYTAAGLYDVMLIAINGSCPNDTAWLTVEVIGVSSLDDSESDLFAIYPNPVSSQLMIQGSTNHAAEIVTIEIRDARGRVVYHLENVSTSETIVIEMKENQIEPGVYLVQVMTTESTVIQKIIVE
jgi:PKD repeat protein